MTAQARYLVLSLYEIPAMQITTSCGSRASGFPFDRVWFVAGSRRFFAYSRAAHEAPSFNSGSSWTVSLRWNSEPGSEKAAAGEREFCSRGRWHWHSRSTFGKDGDCLSRLERIERRRKQFLIVLREKNGGGGHDKVRHQTKISEWPAREPLSSQALPGAPTFVFRSTGKLPASRRIFFGSPGAKRVDFAQ